MYTKSPTAFLGILVYFQMFFPQTGGAQTIQSHVSFLFLITCVHFSCTLVPGKKSRWCTSGFPSRDQPVNFESSQLSFWLLHRKLIKIRAATLDDGLLFKCSVHRGTTNGNISNYLMGIYKWWSCSSWQLLGWFRAILYLPQRVVGMGKKIGIRNATDKPFEENQSELLLSSRIAFCEMGSYKNVISEFDLSSQMGMKAICFLLFVLPGWNIGCKGDTIIHKSEGGGSCDVFPLRWWSAS